jgi:hypothetical protein
MTIAISTTAAALILLVVFVVSAVLCAVGIVAVVRLGRIAEASETTKLIASNHRDLADAHLRFVQTLADQGREGGKPDLRTRADIGGLGDDL